jgi:hypothetical protein
MRPRWTEKRIANNGCQMSKAGINSATTHRSYTELVEDYILMIKGINDERSKK